MENKYVINWEKYASLARQAAAEGAVLLKNDDQALPLKKETISVFGRIQFHYYKSGTGSGGLVNAKYVVGITDALLKKICPSMRNWQRFTVPGSQSILLTREAAGRRSPGARRKCLWKKNWWRRQQPNPTRQSL